MKFNKKAVALTIALIVALSATFLLTPATDKPDASSPQEQRDVSSNNKKLNEKQQQFAEKLLAEPIFTANDEKGNTLAQQLIADYLVKNKLTVSTSDQTLLVKDLLQLRALTAKARANLEQEQPLYTSEDQLQFITTLMQGNSAFKTVLGINVSEFLETLSEDQMTELLAGNENR